MVRKWGDRYDAYRIRDIDGLHFYMAYLMPKRTEAEVYINEKIDVTELLSYIKEKNQSGERKVTLFHCIIAAVARTIKMRPLLNRYISGKRYYMRHEISMGFTIKKKFSDHSEETLMIYRPKDSENLCAITDRISPKVTEAKRENKGQSVDDILNIVKKLPKPLMNLFMAFINFADVHGLMPKSFSSVDTNYCTVLLSNLGSIKCDAVYHHLNNMGTNGIVITIGEIHKEMMIDENGNQDIRDVINIGVTLDERIADGFYFARSLKLIKHLFKNPALLDKTLGEEIDFEF
ncbi:MAG: 2-oxo acid dehydrogenase subunit E2 [Ruminococcaceae bacterium]|nr:2-oxo acid dehydrogenase subunit E2 [Oscillospiraceae bacterium]